LYSSALTLLAASVNRLRRDNPPKTRGAPAVSFWYLDCDGVLYGVGQVPVKEGGRPMTKGTVRAPPFADWMLLGGRGGRSVDPKERAPELHYGCVRCHIKLEDEDEHASLRARL